jgi:hypothetical protein
MGVRAKQLAISPLGRYIGICSSRMRVSFLSMVVISVMWRQPVCWDQATLQVPLRYQRPLLCLTYPDLVCIDDITTGCLDPVPADPGMKQLPRGNPSRSPD